MMKKIIKHIISLICIIVIAIVSFFIFKGYKMYKKAIEITPISTMVENIQNRKNFITIKEMPQDYINAVIAVEDRRFYSHNGIDYISIARAIFVDLKNLNLIEGGSTITQQVAKNNLFTQEKHLERKIAEVFASFALEKICSKDEIFELYVNTSYFGDGYYCVKDATFGYFDKEPKDMDLYESTLLAGIPNAPSVYAPTKNPDLARERQAQVIEKMIKNNYLTKEQAESIGF